MIVALFALNRFEVVSNSETLVGEKTVLSCGFLVLTRLNFDYREKQVEF